MRSLFLAMVAALACSARPASAQSASALPATTGNAQNRIALATRPEKTEAARPMRLACAPLGGQVFEPNGKPLLGATLLIKGTQQVYVTNADGRFDLTETVYQGQVLTVQAAGYTTREIPLADCSLPRLVLEKAAGARIKRTGKRAGQVTRLHHRTTNLK